MPADADSDYEPAPRPARRHSALAAPSRLAQEGSSLQPLGQAGGDWAAAGSSLTAEELGSSQRARAAGRGPGLPVVEGRIIKPKPGSGWPGPNPDGFDEPPVLEGRNALPNYGHIRQNVWVSKPRPK